MAHYAWSTLYNGGDSKDYPNGRRVVESRNVVKPGEEVSAAKLDVSKEEFEHLVETGSVRTYKYPDIPDTYSGSPVRFVREQLLKGEEEIPEELLLAGVLGGQYHGPTEEEVLLQGVEKAQGTSEKK